MSQRTEKKLKGLKWWAFGIGVALAVIAGPIWAAPKKPKPVKKEDAKRIIASATAVATPQYQVFAWNDLGMHCYDSDFSLFSLLPPFNTVHAQVVRKGARPVLVNASEVDVTFAGVADPSGSINTTSFGKTNFWSHSGALFGANLPIDQGLTGTRMPGLANAKQPMAFGGGAAQEWTILGLPITSLDDQMRFRPYPMLRIAATAKGKTTPATTLDVVVPVSSEMDCKSCHATGQIAANDLHSALLDVDLSDNDNLDLQARENILKVHDARYNTTLWQNRPVLCASCHYSKALDLTGTGPNERQAGHAELSRAMHLRHGKSLDNQLPTLDNPAIIPDQGVTACYKCHPGNETNCLRSVMAGAGVGCQNCHGDLLSVGGQFRLTDGRVREPWTDLPKCQSCHTGDHLKNLGGALPRLVGHAADDPAATPIEAPASRFAENADTLYRNSHGHGGLACVACHGSPHAEWPATDPQANDNITPRQLQGHAGVITECSTCHTADLANSLNGPHGMHNVNSPSWIKDHKEIVEKQGMATCRACHGADLKGARLSKTPVARTFTIEDRRRVNVAAGTAIGCTLCHKMPKKPDYPSK